ncbi:cation:proton antiporter [Methanosalsum natronophilum]|uniref:Sodium:proton exchanger n=1 Tax=Methanosalsum natronophilum TaxID=768733 RepID=A0A424Z115_9EURY|nr:cation:proton antiporter family protein [Methanosalsum natronophilum]MCS3923542.1 Kef-type K+ transport system membrane component KefB [Methanosalsum natronophilum]RQD87871.1 MAG: sodium:proton exchanger [Methanosalsum natronophilum]
MFFFENVFYEISILILLATVFGAIMLRLKQPLIVAFIIIGILVGPSYLGWIEATEEVELLAEMGIALLLFVVGLKLDLHLIRTLGPIAVATGLGQVIFTSVFGFFIALGLGLDTIPALYVAVALTFSSTIIIVKLLSDKKEVDELHGRIAIGFLIVQDIVVVLVMIGLSALGAGTAAESDVTAEIIFLFLSGIAFLAAIAFMMFFVLPTLLRHLAKSQELMVLFAVAWALSLASIGDYLGFSKEVGAFLGGVSLASTQFREAIGSRLVSLRDFLLLFFFLHLGSQLDMGILGDQVTPAIILSLFVLIGNPIIVLTIMGIMGYRKRTGFLAGLTVAQISEFSLILAALGYSLGHIGTDTVGMITLVGLITIGTSTYMIIYSHQLYDRLAPYLSIFERKKPSRGHSNFDELANVDIIIFGMGRFGSNIGKNLKVRGRKVLAIDFDPKVTDKLQELNYDVYYGDAEDMEYLNTLPLSRTGWVVSAVPQRHTNLTLMRALREHGYKGKIAVTAHNESDASFFYMEGADLVFMPFVDAASNAADKLT